MITGSDDWDIPRKIWMILLSWGAGVLVLATLLSFWIWSNQQDVVTERDHVQREQDRAMCAMVAVLLAGPEPVAGPEGDHSRSIRSRIADYQAVIRCDDFDDEPPAKPRN